MSAAALALALAAALAGCGGEAKAPVGAQDAPVKRAAAPGTAQAVPPPATAAPARLAGLGPRTLARIPEDTRQVLLVTGRGKDSPESRAVLHRRTGAGWEAGATWPAHNGFRGWTDDHRLNDLRSPVGVFTLTDAGGLLADPGTRLPYDRSRGFTIAGTGFEGEPLAGSFDYVVAIDYNRKTGTSPLDWTRPLGADKGGGVWLHVDHGGPTHGCVSLRRTHMRKLLRALDPRLRPVVVMGDAGSLAR